MGTVSRLSPHHVVSRRRSTRRKAVLRRHAAWPQADGLSSREGGAVASDASPQPAAEPNSDGLAPLGFEARPEPSALDLPLNTLPWSAPFAWLKAGWRDFTRAPAIGLFYGLCFVLMGWALVGTFQRAPEYTLALSAGFLLDGFPRTLAQAEALDAMLAKLEKPLDCTLFFDVDFDEITKRLLSRGRADDNEDTIRKRLAVYEEQTAPLISYYEGTGKLKTVKGVGSVDEISQRIFDVLDAHR